MKILLTILLLAVPVLGQTPAKPEQSPAANRPVQGPPPKNLTKQPDGHVSANTDPANADKFETHVVLAGETLSQIAGVVLKDSKLWPQLWEMNEHIVNPHWIYPNDKILIHPITKITEATPPAPVAPSPAAAPTPAAAPAPAAAAPAPAVPVAAAPPAPQQPPPVPASVGIAVLSRFLRNPDSQPTKAVDVFDLPQAPLVPGLKSSDVYCSGFVRSEPVPNALQISSTYLKDKASFSTQGEYVRLNHGSTGDVALGAMYQVVRPTRKVKDPSKGIGADSLGMHYLDVAQVKVVQVKEDFALAEIQSSCDAAEPGDVLIPYVRLEVPELPRNRAFSSAMTATGNIKGVIAFFRNSVAVSGSIYSSSTAPSARSIVAAGGVVYLNVGKADGVKPGDLFIVYHGSAAIGEVAVTKVEEKSASSLVTYSTEALALGDPVERR